jgi:putative transposase
MKNRRHTPNRSFVSCVRPTRRLLVAPQSPIADTARQLGVSERNYHRWRYPYGGMKADGAKPLRELEKENARLKGRSWAIRH